MPTLYTALLAVKGKSRRARRASLRASVYLLCINLDLNHIAIFFLIERLKLGASSGCTRLACVNHGFDAIGEAPDRHAYAHDAV